MLNILSQQTLYCQSGEKDQYIEALSNCDYSNSVLENKLKKLTIEIDQLKYDLSVCDKSDSTKSVAISNLLKEKTLLLKETDILLKEKTVLKLRVESLEKKNKRKWYLALAGIVLGIFVTTI